MAARPINSCSNSGNITVETYGPCYVGGICGIATSDISSPYITNVYNTGNITVSKLASSISSCIGGLIGENLMPLRIGFSSGDVIVTGTSPYIYCAYITGFSSSSNVFDHYYNVDAQCKKNGIDINLDSGYGHIFATGYTLSEMKDPDFSYELNTLVNDFNSANPTYPHPLYIYGAYGTENGGFPSFVTLPGSGTSDDPYVIDSAARLLYFSQSVSAGNSFAYKHLAVVRDIDLCGDDSVLWTPVGGIVGYSFMGDILNTFFTGTVNVHFIDCSRADSAAYAGGIAGRLYMSTLKNCYVRGGIFISSNIYSNENELTIGLITGIASESEIENCCHFGSSLGLYFGKPLTHGGICGRIDNVTIKFCVDFWGLFGSGENTDPDYVISNNYFSSNLPDGVTVGPGTYHTDVDILNAWTCMEDPDGSVYYGWKLLDEVNSYIGFGSRAYPIEAGAADNGTISAAAYFAFPGDSVVVSTTPDTGYTLKTQRLNGNAFTGDEFTMPSAPVTLSAEFEPLDIRYGLTHKYYTVIPDKTETLDGTLAEGTAYDGHAGKFLSGKYGDVLTADLLKNESFNSEAYALFSATPSGGYTLTDDFSQSFELVYKRYVYGITLSPVANGTVEVSGGLTGLAGSSKTVTITPDTGYAVADVRIDGVSVGSVLTHSFDDIVQNHTLEVIFELVPIPDTGADSIPALLPAALALLSANALAALLLYKKLRSRR